MAAHLIKKEQLYSFHEEIKQFYRQYESNYQSFESSLALTIARQGAFNDKYLS
jgi:hypothetical protein